MLVAVHLLAFSMHASLFGCRSLRLENGFSLDMGAAWGLCWSLPLFLVFQSRMIGTYY